MYNRILQMWVWLYGLDSLFLLLKEYGISNGTFFATDIPIVGSLARIYIQYM